MADSTPYDFDFAVAGGGPAGTSAAISLAQRGHRVVLFERETFPRFHIGESLIASVHEAFLTLGVADAMETAGFPKKRGARLLTHDGACGRGVDFEVARGIRKPQTFQVPRAEFDQILLNRAREVGVEVREASRVQACEFDDQGATVTTVPVRPAAGTEERQVRVRAVVDATGRDGLLARKFSLRQDDPALANIAIYSHYRGVPKLDGDRPDDLRLIARADAGWCWTIPIANDLTSVGVVFPKNLFVRLPGGTNEERLNRAFADTPVLAELMRHATREWPVRAEKDFSYTTSSYAGDRWILVGDAGAFLDPVFSTGVAIALESGLEAAAELDRAARSGIFGASCFAAYSKRQGKRYAAYRRFVLGFYSPEFRDRFFDPTPPTWIFRSVVTVLAGNWNPDLWTRLVREVFFASVALQKHFPRARLHFRRDADAGYR